jgi:hypothetical protein
MDHMTQVEDASAWVRLKRGVFKQADVYRRGSKHYLKHAGGFVRICEQFGGEWLTSHPDIKVLEVEGFTP